MKLISHCLTPCHQISVIRSLIRFGKSWNPLAYSVLYLRNSCTEASPKAISRRTSYIRIRLEFLRYPQVITDYFNRRVFGPPQCLTTASTCSWIGHPVSGLRHATFALFKLAFASAPWRNHLTSLHIVTRRPILQKVRHHTLSSALSACKHKVSGSLSLPSRGSFHRSFTVLFAIGHLTYLALGDGPPMFPPDSSCPVVLRNSPY